MESPIILLILKRDSIEIKISALEDKIELTKDESIELYELKRRLHEYESAILILQEASV